MKRFLLAGFLLAAASGVSGKVDELGREVINEFKITVTSEVEDLANGYAMAYGQLSRWVNLTYERDGQRQVLSGVRAIKAVKGVLLVEVGKGALYVINPKDVISITDDIQAGGTIK